MTDLRIADAPELATTSIDSGLKIPTGGFGNYSITVGGLRDWLVNFKDIATKTYVGVEVGKVDTKLTQHVSDITNPHKVTKVQVGLGNVDNTADMDKPVSNATASALSLIHI